MEQVEAAAVVAAHCRDMEQVEAAAVVAAHCLDHA
jgi:hypothetical protein